MSSKLTITFTMAILALLLIVSCAPAELKPATTSETPIPSDYTTYTSEGLLSISYPPDWAAATSFMEELLEEVLQWMDSVDPSISTEEIKVLFLGGIPTLDGYDPNVNVLAMPRGYSTLEEIVETESAWASQFLLEYHEYAQIRTTIDGRDTVIIDSEDNDPEFGRTRYLQAYVIKGEFVWVVSCATTPDKFKSYESDFYSIVRSFRILN